MTEQHQACAEYLALAVAKRTGTRDPVRLASLTGLPEAHLRSLLRTASVADVRRLRAVLDACTTHWEAA